MTTTHFLERLLSADLSLRTHRTARMTPEQIFDFRLRYLSDTVRWTYRSAERKITVVVPTTRNDGATGYVRITGQAIDYREDAVDFAPACDRAALAVAVTLIYDYSDTVDIRQHTDLVALCRGLLHAAESERAFLAMVLSDFVLERGYASEDY